MKRRAVVVLSIAVVVVGVFLVLSRPGPTPSAVDPTKVTVNVRRLPAVCNVLGAELRLQVERTSANEVWIRFRGRDTRGSHARGILRVSNASFVRTAGSPRASHLGHWEDSFVLGTHAEWARSMPVNCPSLTIEQSIYLDRPEKNLKFKFKDISPADLPVTRRIGDVEVTLQRVYVNDIIRPHGVRLKNSYGGITPGICAFAVEVCLRSPSGFMNRLEGFGFFRGGGESHPTLIDEKGRAHSVTGGIFSDEYLPGYHPLPPSAVERLVGLVDEDRALAMLRRRDEAWKREIGLRQIRIYAYPIIDPPPSRFTVEIPVAIPPDPGDTAMVTFKNVSVPRTVSP